MRKRRNSAEAAADVDMTPMLDIVFIMLIFFIVTTSFVKEDGIVIHRPAENSDKTKIDRDAPILIEISESSEVSISGRIVETNAIRANIEAARSGNSSAIVIVRAHESATAGIVISAVDQSRLAGIDMVTVVKPAS